MKVNEATLQHIIKSYGNKSGTQKTKNSSSKNEKPEKAEPTNQNEASKKLKSEELDLIKYDKDGNLTIDSQKKEALIDFFQ